MRWHKKPKISWSERRYKHKSSWHKWFAWYPITINDEINVWLEYVKRKGKYVCICNGGLLEPPTYSWEYIYSDINDEVKNDK